MKRSNNPQVLRQQVEVLLAALDAGLEHEAELEQRAKSEANLRNAAADDFNERIRELKSGKDADAKYYENEIAQKVTRITQLGEQNQILVEKVNAANATRDLIVDLVRRFTSLQITGLGTQTQPHVQVGGYNAPHELRSARNPD